MPTFAYLTIIFLLGAGGLASPADAMIFSRENINIVTVRIPAAMTLTDEDKQTEADKETEKKPDGTEEASPPTPEPKETDTVVPAEPVEKRHVFSTEIYPMSATNISWFSNREALAAGRGIMIVLDDRDELSLGWSNTSTAYDVLFVQGNGNIQTIVPNLVLGELSDPLEITGKIKAVLYLPAGATAALDIKPKDRVEHALFKPSPLILQ